MSKITNNTDIPLGLAVWILADNYDYQDIPNYISATSLMRPIKQIVLRHRLEETEGYDLSDRIPAALGNALHDSIEKAWLENYEKSLALLGYPKSLIDRILINPTDEQLKAAKEPIPIYLEQRAIREIDGYMVGGKFDMVAEGIVQDNKSTSAWTWVHGGKDDDYALQGSIYRWLNPDKITEDFVRINFIFTDWQKASALSNPDYPDSRCKHRDIPLLEIRDTEEWIRGKLREITKFWDAPQSQVPDCTEEELWRQPPKYKYYSDPAKVGGRSTKNFDDEAEAISYKNAKGKGIIITDYSEPQRCKYCEVFSICEQGQSYFS